MKIKAGDLIKCSVQLQIRVFALFKIEERLPNVYSVTLGYSSSGNEGKRIRAFADLDLEEIVSSPLSEEECLYYRKGISNQEIQTVEEDDPDE